MAKYNVPVVAISNDDTGISEDPDVRFAVAKKIVERASDFGIPANDIVVDPLVMPIGAMATAGNQVFTLVRKLREDEGLKAIFKHYQAVVTLEDAAVNTSFGASVVALAQELGCHLPIHCLGVPDAFIAHGPVSVLRKEVGIDANGIASFLQDALKRLM